MKFIVWRARNHPFLIFCSFSYNKMEENFSMFLPKKYSTKLQMLYILGVGMRR